MIGRWGQKIGPKDLLEVLKKQTRKVPKCCGTLEPATFALCHGTIIEGFEQVDAATPLPFKTYIFYFFKTSLYGPVRIYDEQGRQNCAA